MHPSTPTPRIVALATLLITAACSPGGGSAAASQSPGFGPQSPGPQSPGPQGNGPVNGGPRFQGPATGAPANTGPEGGQPTNPGERTRIRFADVTTAAGIRDEGISFGASAGDVDGDGWPDIFTSGHYDDHPRLWRNLGDGTFVAWPYDRFDPAPDGDLHGASFVDIDEDGSDELVLLTGACYGTCTLPNRCYTFDPQTARLVDMAASLGLAAPLMRARTPIPLDFGAEGRIDLFYTALLRPDQQAPPTLFEQTVPGGFSATGALTLHTDNAFAVVGDLDGDRVPDLLFDTAPTSAWSVAGGVANEITVPIGLPEVSNLEDAVIVDLTGDGDNEIYCARRETRSQYHLEPPHRAEALLTHGSQTQGLRIRTTTGAGRLNMRIQFGSIPYDHVFVGATGFNPAFAAFEFGPQFAAGKPPPPAVFPSLLLWWDAATGFWTVELHVAGQASTMLRMLFEDPIETVEPIGFPPDRPPLTDTVLARSGDYYVDRTAAMGLDAALESRSVVAADFDNDMDLDLFVVVASGTRNLPNVLYENLGDGTFLAADAGAARGTPLGIGDTAVTLDYDRDGRVDLFTVNGAGPVLQFIGRSGAFADDGPVELLRNVSDTGNHWLALDLVGTTSHRSAIGARVELTCGGRTQVREVTGGMHRYSQNHRAVHFGLGAHAAADRIEVHWPSGQQTVLQNVLGNRYLTVTEP